MSGYPDGYEPRLFLAKAVAALAPERKVGFDNPVWKDAEMTAREAPGFFVDGRPVLYLLDNRMPDNQWQNDAAKTIQDIGGLVFCAQKKDAEQHGFTWLPLAVTPDYLGECDRDILDNYEFAFVGYLNDLPRRALMERMQSRFTGNVQSGVFGEDAVAAYLSGRVGLNIPAFYGSPFAHDINMRVFEVCAVGVPLLTPRLDGMEALEFEHGVNCFMYRDAIELSTILELALTNDAYLSKVGQAGHELVMTRHLYSHRAGRVLEALG